MTKQTRKTLWTVVIRELTSNTGLADNQAVCVRRARGPGVTKVQSHILEHKLACEYAASIGCKAAGRGEVRPKDSELVCIVKTYRSFDKEGRGRSSSTLTTYVVYREATK